jgi:hypothetical protein
MQKNSFLVATTTGNREIEMILAIKISPAKAG